MAAGYGTRLYPLTLDTPKPLLKVGNKLMIEHTLALLEEVKDIDAIFIVTNDRFYSRFVAWQKGYRGKVPIKILNDGTRTNEERLGAIGDIHFVLQQETIDDELIVIGGDNLTETPLKKMVEAFRKKDGSIIGIRDAKDQSMVAKKLGVVIVDREGRIIDFEEKPEKPKSTLAATLIYIIKKKDVPLVTECLSEQEKPDHAGSFIQWLSKRKKVYGYLIKEKWFDIGSLDQYKEADAYYGKRGKQ